MNYDHITEDFKWVEFKCKCCGTNLIRVGVVHRLQLVRDIIKVPIIVTSGFRCVKHNQEIGAAQNSYHIYGEAVDWTIDNKHLLDDIAHNLLHNWSGGFHYYPDMQIIHCDIGPRRRW